MTCSRQRQRCGTWCLWHLASGHQHHGTCSINRLAHLACFCVPQLDAGLVVAGAEKLATIAAEVDVPDTLQRVAMPQHDRQWYHRLKLQSSQSPSLGGSSADLGVAQVSAHVLAAAVDVPHLDLAVQPSRQQQVPRLWEEADRIDTLRISQACQIVIHHKGVG